MLVLAIGHVVPFFSSDPGFAMARLMKSAVANTLLRGSTSKATSSSLP
jgi:hypothetical protein